MTQLRWKPIRKIHSRKLFLCVKIVRVRGFSGPYFPAFGLNKERHSVSLLIQSECEKIRTRETPNADTFHTVIPMLLSFFVCKIWYELRLSLIVNEPSGVASDF